MSTEESHVTFSIQLLENVIGDAQDDNRTSSYLRTHLKYLAYV